MTGPVPAHGTKHGSLHWLRYGSQEPTVARWSRSGWNIIGASFASLPEELEFVTYIGPAMPPSDDISEGEIEAAQTVVRERFGIVTSRNLILEMLEGAAKAHREGK